MIGRRRRAAASDRGSPGRLALALTGVLAGGAATACSKAPEPSASAAPPLVDSAAPRKAALDYFDALAKRDCPALEAVVGGRVAERVKTGGCAAEFDEFADHHMRIDGAGDATKDGRSENVFLIRVNANQDGKDRVILVGVERLEGRWAVTRI
jgi:hypothetical protein